MVKMQSTEHGVLESKQQDKLKITAVTRDVVAPTALGELERVAPCLFNLEPYSEPEKPLKIDVDLYQMESNQLPHNSYAFGTRSSRRK